MNLIDGKILSKDIKDKLKKDISDFNIENNCEVSLAVVLIGNDPASQVYVKNKIKACEYVGIKSYAYYLPENSTNEQVEELIISLANDNKIDGILVQLPLPKHLNENKILNLIPADKDVDGFNPNNIGNLLLGKNKIVSCTPLGIIKMLKSTGTVLSGKFAVIVGRSNIVGKPLSLLLLQENCTVSICHSKTTNLKEICLMADILIVAIGKPKFITSDMIKNNAIVIDVGINRTEEGLVGDVDFNNVAPKCLYISPVPGGVGPMTIAMLMENTLSCAKIRRN